MSLDKNYISKNIKFLRQQKKLSQEQLAEKIGINRGNIASYERGGAEPSAQRLIKFAKIFNIYVEQLVEVDLSETPIEALTDKEEETIKNKLENLLEEGESNIEEYINRFHEFKKIVEGFKQFHKFKIGTYKEFTKELQDLSYDYEKLIDLMENALETNHDLLNKIKKKQ